MTNSPGLQNERTALAWQRMALSVLAGSAIITRVTLDRLGVVALIGLAVTVPLCVWVLVESERRYRHDAGPRARARSRSGRTHAVLAFAVALLGTTELIALIAAG